MRSIKGRLLGWLIFGFVAVSAIAGYGVYLKARGEAGELFDYELRTVALSLPPDVATVGVAVGPSPQLEGLSEDRIAIEVRNQQGRVVYRSEDTPPFERGAEGFRTIEVDEKHWRVFSAQVGERFVQVAQPVSVRDALAARLALRTLWPFALLLPATIVLVLVVVGRALAPIRGVTRALSTRSFEALEPLRFDSAMPVEIRPLVHALNDLLARLGTASQAQRTFVADAAHELRSPLTALRLQLQAAERDGSLKGEGRTLAQIEERLNRLIRLVQQLLALAREDALGVAQMQPVDLRRLAEQAVGDLSLVAETKSIDLGLEVDDAAAANGEFAVMGEPHALTAVLNNLLDNAIRHTPAGGKVDVVLQRDANGIGLSVRDNGPGIPAEELPRVCDRFYRSPGAEGQGSGLGLAIVARIVQRHHASLALRNNEDGLGLTVSIAGLNPAAVETLQRSTQRAAAPE
ncbi:ATP-binding protein [Trinickia sp. EG282A]|uniref:ATP-binding protein n=1 Tax=Trinickia sp. EG282A TaxID=3237013 RepID=UPI0034D30F36